MDNLHIDPDGTASVAPIPIRTMNVTFSGQTCRTSPPTWGQIGMWLMHKRLVSRTETLNLQLRINFPETLTPEDIVRGVISLLCRHEALRTTFHDTEDGRLRTVTLAEGKLAVRIYKATDQSTEASMEAALAAERQHFFDLRNQVPLRLALIGLPAGVYCASLVLPHTAADGFSAGVLKRDLQDILESKEDVEADQQQQAAHAALLQPFEIAANEQSEAGQAESERSLRYWRKTLAHSPRTVFPWGRGINGSKPEIQVVLKSRAVVLAACELASRYEVRMPSVGLAAISSVLGAISEDSRVMYQVTCSNRGFGPIQNSVGCIAQGGLFFVDTGTRAFSQLVTRASRAELMAYSSARYDSVLRNTVVDEVGLHRGVRFDLHTIVSDQLFAERRLAAPQGPYSPASMEEALRATRIECRASDFVASERFLLHMEYRNGEAHLTARADPETFTEHIVSDLLQGIESVLVGACREDKSPYELARKAGVRPPVKKRPQWVHTDTGWVDLSSVSELVERTGLAKVLSVQHSHEDGVVAHLEPKGAGIDEQELHRQVMSLLPDRPSAVAPARYVVEALN
ncbi:condensation domain-containing protein [Streptomyces canus]|uniref:condensation domain-containing protein n=1 Tax=Streptomyces canus TaxID=58343 RepID=UPI0033AD5416